MRPAHQAREVTFPRCADGAAGDASMRPAHQAREVKLEALLLILGADASMRPAHQAREVSASSSMDSRSGIGFNEARASSAGSKRRGDRTTAAPPCFNEARASSAGSNRQPLGLIRTR